MFLETTNFWACLLHMLEDTFYYLIQMPRPSARTKIFLSWTKFKLSRTKVLSRVKKSIFCLQKSFKMKLPDWKSLENLSSIRNIYIQWLLKVQLSLLISIRYLYMGEQCLMPVFDFQNATTLSYTSQKCFCIFYCLVKKML